MKVMPIVFGALGTIPKSLIRELEMDEPRPFKPQCFYDRLEYWEESWILEGTCCHSDASESLSITAGVKSFKGVI